MKILYFLPGTAVAGGALVVFEHLNRLAKRGHEVRLISFYNQSPEVKWYPLDITPEPFQNITEASEWADIIVATHYITVFFVNELDVNATKFYLVQNRESWFISEDSITVGPEVKDSNRFKKEFVKDYRKYIEKSYTLPLKHIAVSAWLADFLRKEYKSKPLEIRNGINKEIFYPEPTYPVQKGKTRVLVETTNQKTKWKGLDTAKEALKDFKNLEIWTLSADDPIWSVDKHWKSPSQDEIRRIYSSCDILIKASKFEGVGLGPMQAMCTGTAVLTTDNKGSRDFCIDKQNASVVPPEQPKAMRVALRYLIKHPVFRKKLIKNGLETAKTFEWEPQIDKLEKEYEKYKFRIPRP